MERWKGGKDNDMSLLLQLDFLTLIYPLVYYLTQLTGLYTIYYLSQLYSGIFNVLIANSFQYK